MADEMPVGSYEVAGQYFIDLALGNSPIPSTTEQAKVDLAANTVDVSAYTKVIFHTNTPDELHLVIARPDWTQTTIDGLSNDTAMYAFPAQIDAMYRDFFTDTNGTFEGPQGMGKRMKLFRHRIADYTLGQCK